MRLNTTADKTELQKIENIVKIFPHFGFTMLIICELYSYCIFFMIKGRIILQNCGFKYSRKFPRQQVFFLKPVLGFKYIQGSFNKNNFFKNIIRTKGCYIWDKYPRFGALTLC